MKDEHFLLKWLAGNLLGQAFGGIFCCVFYPFSIALAAYSFTFFTLWDALNNLSIRLGLVLAGAAFGALVGAMVGRLQWIVMEPQVGSGKEWVLLSATMGGVGWACVWNVALPLAVSVLTSLD